MYDQSQKGRPEKDEKDSGQTEESNYLEFSQKLVSRKEDKL